MLQAVEYHQSTTLSDFQQTLTTNLKTKLTMNQLAFRQYMPNVLQQLADIEKTRFKVMVTRFDVVNVHDVEHGTVLYGENPAQESEQHIKHFLKAAPTLNFDGTRLKRSSLIPSYSQVALKGEVPQCKLPLVSVPARPDTIFMLGLGLGYVLQQLLKMNAPQNLVIYEPNIDLFLASLQVMDWAELFELAERKNVRLFLQLGTDGSSLQNDINELRQAMGARTFHVYRHYPCVSLDKAFANLFGLKGPGNESVVPIRACLHPLTSFDGKDALVYIEAIQEQFMLSMNALEVYDDETARKLKGLKIARWQGYTNIHGELNLLDTSTGWPLYFDCEKQSLETQGKKQAEFSAKKPAMVELPASRSQGKSRLWHHHTVIRRAGYIRELSIGSDPLQLEYKPFFIPGHVINGWGLGYGQIDWFNYSLDFRLSVVIEADVEVFFYALGASSSHALFASMKPLDRNVVLWLGLRTSQIPKKLLTIFRSSKGYTFGAMQWHTVLRRKIDLILAEVLLNHVNRIPLQILNFDDFRFTLNHTALNVQRGAKFLRKKNQKHKVTAVVVGNGPSLGDSQLNWLKRNREQVIIVSCGTSLFTLYQAGIQPNFHSEGEINRATFDWVNSVNDSDYLNQIRVLGTSGIHPDTAALFAEQYLAFKADEHATDFMAQIPGFSNECVCLAEAYPTVTNFAVSMLLHLGVQHIVLMGVDYSISEKNKHHSAASIYEKKHLTDKQAGFDSDKILNDNIVVPGNIRKQVRTKFEFQLAIEAMSTLLEKFPQVKVENVSEGALISRASPILLENIRPLGGATTSLEKSFQPIDSCFSASLLNLDWSETISYMRSLRLPSIEQYSQMTRSEIFDETERVMEELLVNRESKTTIFPLAVADLIALACAYRALLSCYRYLKEDKVEGCDEVQGLLSAVTIIATLSRELIEDLEQDPYRLDSTQLNFL